MLWHVARLSKRYPILVFITTVFRFDSTQFFVVLLPFPVLWLTTFFQFHFFSYSKNLFILPAFTLSIYLSVYCYSLSAWKICFTPENSGLKKSISVGTYKTINCCSDVITYRYFSSAAVFHLLQHLIETHSLPLSISWCVCVCFCAMHAAHTWACFYRTKCCSTVIMITHIINGKLTGWTAAAVLLAYINIYIHVGCVEHRRLKW